MWQQHLGISTAEGSLAVLSVLALVTHGQSEGWVPLQWCCIGVGHRARPQPCVVGALGQARNARSCSKGTSVASEGVACGDAHHHADEGAGQGEVRTVRLLLRGVRACRMFSWRVVCGQLPVCMNERGVPGVLLWSPQTIPAGPATHCLLGAAFVYLRVLSYCFLSLLACGA